MKKALKIVGKALLGILILLIAFLLILFIYHRIMLGKETELLKSCPGEFVEVDGKNMSIYVSGEGEHTLVFMSGSGITLPIYDYKPFTERFEDEWLQRWLRWVQRCRDKGKAEQRSAQSRWHRRIIHSLPALLFGA